MNGRTNERTNEPYSTQQRKVRVDLFTADRRRSGGMAAERSSPQQDIRGIQKLGGTVDDTELVEGLVLDQRSAGGGPTRVEKAKIGLIKFCISPRKTDVIISY